MINWFLELVEQGGSVLIGLNCSNLVTQTKKESSSMSPLCSKGSKRALHNYLSRWIMSNWIVYSVWVRLLLWLQYRFNLVTWFAIISFLFCHHLVTHLIFILNQNPLRWTRPKYVLINKGPNLTIASAIPCALDCEIIELEMFSIDNNHKIILPLLCVSHVRMYEHNISIAMEFDYLSKPMIWWYAFISIWNEILLNAITLDLRHLCIHSWLLLKEHFFFLV